VKHGISGEKKKKEEEGGKRVCSVKLVWGATKSGTAIGENKNIGGTAEDEKTGMEPKILKGGTMEKGV